MQVELTYEEKQKKIEEKIFRKNFNKHRKLCGDINNFKKNIGKAPVCNSNNTKKEISVTAISNKKKK